MPRSLRIASIAVLITQIVIVGTGGLVRLTGSGLGCSTWPNCTPESFVPVAEQGVHGIIEFSNRVMGGVTLLVALAMLVLAILHRRRTGERTDIVALAAVVLALTIAQALIGAVVVWMHLRPDTVGIHFVVSVLLVAISTLLAWRVLMGRPGPAAAPAWQRALAIATYLMLVVVVFIGVLTTGSGPHAGDEGTARNGLDPAVMQHVHAIPAYVLFGLSLALLGAAWMRGQRLHRILVIALVAVELVQMVVGIVQSNTGLPIGLVAVHLVGSVLLVCIGTAALLALRPPATAPLTELPLDEPARDEPAIA